MINNYKIRCEEKDDYYDVENLTREAFFNVYKPGCDEHYVLHKFRNNPDFIKGLSLVVCDLDKIIAHIMYCKTKIIDLDKSFKEVLMFGPVSVLPEYQAKGIGSMLITYSLDKAKDLGYKAVAITGNPKFYTKLGFELGFSFNIFYEDINNNDLIPFFLVKELESDYLSFQKGVLIEPKDYQVDKEEVDKFDLNFPYKEKLKLDTQIFN
ncbi:MAG: GNAT family N-acetyltransferase [Pleomorphochaeta sp.]